MRSIIILFSFLLSSAAHATCIFSLTNVNSLNEGSLPSLSIGLEFRSTANRDSTEFVFDEKTCFDRENPFQRCKVQIRDNIRGGGASMQRVLFNVKAPEGKEVSAVGYTVAITGFFDAFLRCDTISAEEEVSGRNTWLKRVYTKSSDQVNAVGVTGNID